jgi:hypothetical protein
MAYNSTKRDNDTIFGIPGRLLDKPDTIKLSRNSARMSAKKRKNQFKRIGIQHRLPKPKGSPV